MASFSLKETLEKVKSRTGFDRLEKREKLTVSLGLLFLLGLLFVNVVVSPLLSERGRAQRSIVTKERELKRILSLKEEYKQVANKVDGIAERVAQRHADFTLFSFLESQATAAKVRELVKYMKPSTEEGEGLLQNSVVEMKLEQISLKELVEFLQRIESPANVVNIGRISIQENGQGDGLLDVVMQIVTFVKKS